MKMIALLAVIAMFFVDVFGPKASVGGPMTMAAVMLIATLAVGIYEASLNKRNVEGWVVNIFAAIFAGFFACSLIGFVLDPILTLIRFEGSLAMSDNPIKYLFSAAMALSGVFGAWAALQLINRSRDRIRTVDGVTQG